MRRRQQNHLSFLTKEMDDYEGDDNKNRLIQ